MATAVVDKHFLDTSVARPMIQGTTAYKRYLLSEIPGKRYVSPFVRMEFRRSLIKSLIHFYGILALPTIQTVSDALTFISNSYKSSELKAALVGAAQLFACRGFDTADPAEKARALHAIADIIIRMDALFRSEFINDGTDSTRCARAVISLNAKPETAAGDFERFSDSFDDVRTCRSQCSIHSFLLNRHRNVIEKYVSSAKDLKKTDANLGFRKIAANLQRILAKGEGACSCHRCERIGDAVIALDAPRDMQLEHLDKSFDQLCSPINQPHRRHLPETEALKQTTKLKP